MTYFDNFFAPCDSKTSAKLAEELLETTTANPMRRWFGIGNAISSNGVMLAVGTAAFLASCGSLCDAINISGTLAVMQLGNAAARNQTDTPRNHRSICYDFAKAVARKRKRPKHPVIRAFCDGALNGLERNGAVGSAKILYATGAYSLYLAASAMVSVCDGDESKPYKLDDILNKPLESRNSHRYLGDSLDVLRPLLKRRAPMCG